MPGIPPSLLSLLLSILLTAIYGAASRKACKHRIILTAAAFILLAAVSVVCASRSGFIAGFAGIAYIQAARSHRRKGSGLMITLTALSLLTVLYFIRPGSADGRILIWAVCLSMICRHPLGYGISGLSNNYMLYQAEFFRNHPDSDLVRYAGNVTISYNEFLHIAVNIGIIGLICAILILADVLSTRKDNGRNDILKAMLITYLTFSLFSFPLANLYTWTALFVILLALKKRFVPKLFNALCIAAIAGGLAYFLQEEHCERTIRNFHSQGYDDETVGLMVESPRRFKIYPTLSDMLLQVKGIDSSRYYDSIVEAAVRNIPNTDSYCRKGDILLSNHQYTQALYYYQEAHAMVPMKLKPLYREFLLYIETGDRDNAVRIGQKILDSKVKIHSSEAVLIKDRVRKQLNEINK